MFVLCTGVQGPLRLRVFRNLLQWSICSPILAAQSQSWRPPTTPSSSTSPSFLGFLGFTLTNYSEIDKMSKEGMLFLPAQLVLPLLPGRGHDGHPHDLVRLYTPGVCASHYLPGLSWLRALGSSVHNLPGDGVWWAWVKLSCQWPGLRIPHWDWGHPSGFVLCCLPSIGADMLAVSAWAVHLVSANLPGLVACNDGLRHQCRSSSHRWNIVCIVMQRKLTFFVFQASPQWLTTCSPP